MPCPIMCAAPAVLTAPADAVVVPGTGAAVVVPDTEAAVVPMRSVSPQSSRSPGQRAQAKENQDAPIEPEFITLDAPLAAASVLVGAGVLAAPEAQVAWEGRVTPALDLRSVSTESFSLIHVFRVLRDS